MTNPIRKEVVIGDCRLLLGDCLEILPTLGKVDEPGCVLGSAHLHIRALCRGEANANGLVELHHAYSIPAIQREAERAVA